MTHFRTSARRQIGLSLVELMISLAIGLLLLAGLTLIFVNSSEANRELQKTAQQIENGRYAIDIVTQDLHHAGYYGHFYDMASITAAASPDPCATTDADLLAAIPTPVQGIRAADLATRPVVTPTTCDDKGLLTNANLRPGSDILVVRRASTVPLAVGVTAPTNEVYIQANGVVAQVQLGAGAAYATGKKADGSTASTIFFKDGVTAAPIRKYIVHVYFVAPCSVGTGAKGVCQAGDDSIPTLKRLELGPVGGATDMSLVPLVEGVEYFKVEYGIDTAPAAPASTITGQTGDSTVDSYTTAPGDWTEVIGARVYILARNTLPTSGFTDDKSYVLGSATVAPADYAGSERFRRHAFTSAIRLSNLAGRREIP
jgi:type IV pilus assembly protein PilW